MRSRSMTLLFIALAMRCTPCAAGSDDCNGNGIPDDLDLLPSLALHPTVHPTLPKPMGAAVTDFDGDGDPDLVVPELEGKALLLLENDGEGTFAADGRVALPDPPAHAASGDLDGDGDSDLAVTVPLRSKVTVLLGDGEGAFRFHRDLPAAQDVRTGALSDLDGDGDLDIATCNPSFPRPATMAVIRNLGGGEFTQPEVRALGEQVEVIAAGDLDRDGDADLAAPDLFQNVVHLLLNRGDGSFGPPEGHVVGDGPASVELVDLEGDGFLDLLVGNRYSHDVSVIRGGPGGLSQQVRIPVGDGTDQDEPLGVHARDVDRDGRLDLLVAAGKGVLVLPREEDGSFGEELRFGTAAGRSVAGDWDGDGDPDLAATVYERGELIVFRNHPTPVSRDCQGDGIPDECQLEGADCDGNGVPDGCDLRSEAGLDCDGNGVLDACDLQGQLSFSLRELSLGGPPVSAAILPTALSAGDLDGDGRSDLAAVNQRRRTLAIFRGRGPDGFAEEVPLAAGGNPGDVDIGDFDRDGDLDLAAALVDQASAGILRNRGDATFEPVVKVRVDRVESVVMADLDRDGLLDVAAVRSRGSSSPPSLEIRLQRSGASFQAGPSLAVGENPAALVAEDLDGDRRLDVAVACAGANQVWILRNEGGGTFSSQGFREVKVRPVSIRAGDLDGDGARDLVAACAGDFGVRGNVSVLMNDGRGTFEEPAAHDAGDSSNSISLADLDGDGDLDAASSSYESRSLEGLLNRGDGTFQPAIPVALSLAPFSVAAGDLDGEGLPDLATLDQGTVIVLHNGMIPPVRTDCDADGVIDSCEDLVEDCDGDGRPDSCAADCNRNGVPDPCEVRDGLRPDCDQNGVPDDCDADCDANAIPDACDLAADPARDCNRNRIPDSCEIAEVMERDRDRSGVLDECQPRPLFHRGDPNGDGESDISDGLFLLAAFFLGGPASTCRESADANNDGRLDGSDGIFLFSFLFLGTQAPPPPGPPSRACGVDADPIGTPGDGGCDSYAEC